MKILNCKYVANLKYSICSLLSRRKLNGMCLYETVLSLKV